jgi:pimeloyl-ACP methyl ester carboxylesterase
MTTNSHLHVETSGSGRPVLLIPGTPGDGGQFAAVAQLLSTDRTVITYDRRGTSRSKAPRGWRSTTVAEQADDAADVLRAHADGQPADVYGTSNGAAVALELASRHPELVRTVAIHEAPLLTVLADPAPVGEMLGSIIGPAMEAGGPAKALEAFLRFAFGDDVFDGIDADLRDRMLANAPMVFEIELPAFQTYRPDDDALSALKPAARVLVGRDQMAPFFAEAAGWLAERLGTDVVTSPGAHGPQFTHPAELADIIRGL